MLSEFGGKQLDASTEEYARIEYNLQVCLRSASTRLESAHDVLTPRQVASFDGEKMALSCWIDIQSLGGANTLDDVLRRGFSIAENGLRLSVGTVTTIDSHLKYHESNSKLDTNIDDCENEVCTVLLCLVAVGRAFVTTENDATQQTPHGYDSLYIPAASSKPKVKASLPENQRETNPSYKHEYILRNSAQILPQYLLTYRKSPSATSIQPLVQKCDVCETADATLYCSVDSAHFCAKCDSTFHNSNKITSKHARVPIKEVRSF